MKDLLKQYIEKGYEPTFTWIHKTGCVETLKYTSHPFDILECEKLELYLMRDWLGEKHKIYAHSLINAEYWYWVLKDLGGRTLKSKPSDTPDYLTRLEALKSALEEAIKYLK